MEMYLIFLARNGLAEIRLLTIDDIRDLGFTLKLKTNVAFLLEYQLVFIF